MDHLVTCSKLVSMQTRAHIRTGWQSRCTGLCLCVCVYVCVRALLLTAKLVMHIMTAPAAAAFCALCLVSLIRKVPPLDT